MHLVLQALCMGVILLVVVCMVAFSVLGVIMWNDQLVIRIYTAIDEFFKRVPGGRFLRVVTGALFWITLSTVIAWISLSIYFFF